MRSRPSAVVPWLTLGVIALIAYGSLYPFNFKPDANDAWWRSVWQALKHLSWERAGRGDRVSNVLLYVPFGFCLVLWCQAYWRQRIAIMAAVSFGAALSLCFELAQVFVSLRVPSLLDVALNTAGTLAGALGGVAWRSLSARLPASFTIYDRRGDASTWALLALWFAWRWAPFAPQFTLGKLKAALAPLFTPQIGWAATAHYLVWWIVLAQAVFALSGAQRGVEMLLGAIAAMLVGTLFIRDLAFAPSELVALAMLLPVLVMLHRLWTPSRRMLVMLAFVALLLVERLAPFTFSAHSAHFDLWPFLAWRAAGMPIDWAFWLRHACEFAALYWLLRGFDLPPKAIAGWVFGGALAMELLALWMPHRNGSITLPVLACAVVLAMQRLSNGAATRPRERIR